MIDAISDKDLFRLFTFALGALLSWMGHMAFTRIKTMETEHDEHEDRLREMEITVAGKYVKRQDMSALAADLHKRLDRIEQKLDWKVDK